MLNEDQILIHKHATNVTVNAHNNTWCVYQPEANKIRMFASKEHKEKWEEEHKAGLERWKRTHNEAPTLETVVVERILNRSQTLEDIHANLESLIENIKKVDWNKLLEIRQEVQLEETLSQGETECSECKQKFSYAQLYQIENRLPGDNYSWSALLYCPSCLSKVYESIFPFCVICGCRHEINTLLDDRDFCDNCRSDKFMFERTRIRKHIERAKSCGALMSLTIKQWLATLDHFEWACAYCNGPYQGLEHYNPLPLGGTTANNCVPSCQPCNIRKNNRTPESFKELFPAENLARIRAWLATQELTEE